MAAHPARDSRYRPSSPAGTLLRGGQSVSEAILDALDAVGAREKRDGQRCVAGGRESLLIPSYRKSPVPSVLLSFHPARQREPIVCCILAARVG